MRFSLQKHHKAVSGLFLALVIFVQVLGPYKNAKAIVPVFDSAANIQLGIANTQLGLLVKKEYFLDPSAYVLKLVVRTLRDMVIRWILTGRFGLPTFSTSFIIDTQQAAENASRFFLSRLTGLNFCAGISLPPPAFFNYDLNLATQCSFNGDIIAFNRGDLFDFGMLAAGEADTNDPQDIALTLLDEKLKNEAIARSSLSNEYLAGGGFLGIRDAKTGKIKTPGRYVADVLAQDVNSIFREYDIADELLEAIVAIVDTFVHKSINDGLAGVF